MVTEYSVQYIVQIGPPPLLKIDTISFCDRQYKCRAIAVSTTAEADICVVYIVTQSMRVCERKGS